MVRYPEIDVVGGPEEPSGGAPAARHWTHPQLELVRRRVKQELAARLVGAHPEPKCRYGVGTIETHNGNQALHDARPPWLAGRVGGEQADCAIDDLLRGRTRVVLAHQGHGGN